MMERTIKPMKPSEPSSSNQLDKHNIRCLNLGLGISLQRYNHRGTLVPRRNFLSHQLLRDTSCLLSTSILHKRPSSPLDSVPLHGQHLSNFLPQPQGRDNISISQLPFSYLAKETWQWCMSQNISLVANHLPGHLNTVADTESRMIRDRCDWQLHPRTFQRISQKWGPFAVNLFASRLTHQLPAYFSWRPDPQAAATDASIKCGHHR